MTADWWLDEGAFAGPEHLDEDYVATYEAKAGFDPTEDIDILRGLGLGDSTTLIDLGAGTGVLAFAAAEAGAGVVAVDVSPAMVAAMHERARHRRGVRIVRAGFLSYQHDGPPADFVYSRNALHQLPDFWKLIALRRIAGLVRPDGYLRLRDLVYDLEPDDIEPSIEAWMGGAVDDQARGYTTADLAAHVRDEFGTFTWLLEPMLDRVGFDIVDREVRRSIYAAYTCRRRT